MAPHDSRGPAGVPSNAGTLDRNHQRIHEGWATGALDVELGDQEGVIGGFGESPGIGVDPGPLTLRELLWMAEGRAEADWAHTSAVLAAVWSANANLKKPKVFRPDEFNPMRSDGQKRKPDKMITKADFGVLKQIITGKRERKGKV